MKYKKPEKLKPGDTVAIVSQSWGGPASYPHIYENGLKILKEWGLKIKEYPSARKSASFLRSNPKFRADDLNNAFADKEVRAIFSSIGGDDSVRILPYLDKNKIKNNPKIFLGFSDATTIHSFLNQLGIVSFYGPSIMAGFSQMKSLPESFEKHTKEILFNTNKEYIYLPYEKYCDGYLDWNEKKNIGKTKKLNKNTGWKVIQGRGKVRGKIFGGCIEVLEMMKETPFWPEAEFWKDKILFLETSEAKPTIHEIDHIIRNYGVQGIFGKISALLIGRARDYSSDEKRELEEKIVSIVSREFGENKLLIATDMDFGHTDPQWVLPLGVEAELDCDKKTFKLTETCLK